MEAWETRRGMERGTERMVTRKVRSELKTHGREGRRWPRIWRLQQNSGEADRVTEAGVMELGSTGALQLRLIG